MKEKKEKKLKYTIHTGPRPDPKELKEIRDQLTYPERDISNIVAPPNATEMDLVKIKICHLIDGYRIEKQLRQKELAKLLSIDESRMSELMKGKVENYTIERLFGYLKSLNPRFKLEVAYVK